MLETWACAEKSLIFMQMYVRSADLHDSVLDLKVKAAVLANRLVRLDNPMTNSRLAELDAKAQCLIQLSNSLTANEA